MAINHNDLVVALIVGGLGMFMVVSDTIIYLGFYRSAYIVEAGNPVFVNKLLLGVPGIGLGLWCLFIAFLVIFPKSLRADLFSYIGIPLLLITIILAEWQPNWLKPKWLRWLEKEHGDIIGLLWEDARKRDRWEWERQVHTQEGLEAWVAQVRRSHGLD